MVSGVNLQIWNLLIFLILKKLKFAHNGVMNVIMGLQRGAHVKKKQIIRTTKQISNTSFYCERYLTQEYLSIHMILKIIK